MAPIKLAGKALKGVAKLPADAAKGAVWAGMVAVEVVGRLGGQAAGRGGQRCSLGGAWMMVGVAGCLVRRGGGARRGGGLLHTALRSPLD